MLSIATFSLYCHILHVFICWIRVQAHVTRWRNVRFVFQTAAGSTLTAMKQNPKANIQPHTNHLRKGGAGGWRDSFTVRESEAFDKIYRHEMKGSGLTMDFGEGLIM